MSDRLAELLSRSTLRVPDSRGVAFMSIRRHFVKVLGFALSSGLLGCIRAENNRIADPRATGGMDIMTLVALVIFGVTFPAACIWLAVRLNKRGQRWAMSRRWPTS